MIRRRLLPAQRHHYENILHRQQIQEEMRQMAQQQTSDAFGASARLNADFKSMQNRIRKRR